MKLVILIEESWWWLSSREVVRVWERVSVKGEMIEVVVVEPK